MSRTMVSWVLAAGLVAGQGVLVTQQLPLASPPFDAAIADVNGDGFADVVAISRESAQVHILLGDGAGAYTPDPSAPVTLGQATGNEAVAALELDGLAGVDLAVVNRQDGTLTLLTNNGSGAFLASSIDLDLVNGGALAPVWPTAVTGIAGAVGEIWITTAGTPFQPDLSRVMRITDPLGSPTVTVVVSGGSFVHLTTGDFDRDGIRDVVAANASTGAAGGLHVILGDGLGGFSAGAPVVPGAGIGHGVVAVESASLDASGVDDDLVVAFYPTAGPFTGPGGTAILVNDGVLAPPGFTGTLLRTSIAGRHAVAGDFAGGAEADIMEVQSVGAVRGHVDLAGGAFRTATDLSGPLGAFVGPDVVRLRAGELDATTFAQCGSRDELVALSLTTSSIFVTRFVTWNTLATADVAGVGDTGVVLTLPGGAPILPNPSFAIGVDGGPARAFHAAAFVAQVQAAGFVPPLPLAGGTSVIIDLFGEYLLLPVTLDAFGTALVPVPLPDEPLLACLKVAVQWAIYDTLGANGISISDGLRATLGTF